MPHGYRPNRRSAITNDTSYAEDAACRRFVEEHPDGATLEEIGDFCGVTRERIRQIEAKALRKLRLACLREGVAFEDFLGVLGVDAQLVAA